MVEATDLLDYEEDEISVSKPTVADTPVKKDVKKGSHVGIHQTGFRDFLLKPELLRAITDCGFEHPSEVQQECIPQAILGSDVLCQAKSGMGKTAVFVLSTLQQIDTTKNEPLVLVLAHTRELAFQIMQEYNRFCKYMPEVKIQVFFGGTSLKKDYEKLVDNPPHIIVGTPGRVLGLLREKRLSLKSLKHFVLDECDKILEQLDMRQDVQNIFLGTKHSKQVMMFSATLSKDIRAVCKKFMQNPLEIYVDDEAKLTLHGLQQHYCMVDEKLKTQKLTELLDVLDFNQVLIFVKSIARADALNRVLNGSGFPSVVMHSDLTQEERLKRFTDFKNFEKRIMIVTDVFARGIDLQRVNIVINYDMPDCADSYLHRVARAGRFGTRGLAITFASTDDDSKILNDIQGRFEVDIKPLPDEIDTGSYLPDIE